MVTSVQTAASARVEAGWRGRVALVAKPGGLNTGVGRYVHMLHEGLRAAGVDAVRVAPTVPPLPGAGYNLLRRMGIDARTFLRTYPVWAAYPRADVYHITSQNLATLLLLRRPPGRVVVTVHDIIPYMLRNDARLCTYRTAADRLFDRMAMAGLRRADLVVAVSTYTRSLLVERLGLSRHRVAVVYEPVDLTRFRPIPLPQHLMARHGLAARQRFVLYVGSEHPRKNLPELIGALPIVLSHMPDVTFLKVGAPHHTAERQRLREQVARLGLGERVRFIDDVSEDDLVSFYCLADVVVMPSLLEGFGLPVLEAMACGRPVVAANRSSLPEVLGDAGLIVEPGDPDRWAAALLHVLSDADLARTYGARGQQRAAQFSVSQQTHGMQALYAQLSSGVHLV